ncbi:MAG: hypothetical protein R2697_12540 [Ilumatobacteraceae bacterium]
MRLGTGPVVWTAGELLDPATWSADVPESILTDIEARALSASSIVAGIRYVVAQARIALDGANIDEELPIIGDAYSAGSSALADLEAFMAKVENIVATVDAASNAGALQNGIKTFFVNNIGPSSQLEAAARHQQRQQDRRCRRPRHGVVRRIAVCVDGAARRRDRRRDRLRHRSQRDRDVDAVPVRRARLRIRSDDLGERQRRMAGRVPRRHRPQRLLPRARHVERAARGVARRDRLDAGNDRGDHRRPPVRLTDQHAGSDLQIQLGVDLLGADTDRLRMGELISRGGNVLDESSIAFTARGCADLELGLEVRVPGANAAQALPGILGDLGPPHGLERLPRLDRRACRHPRRPGTGRAPVALRNVRLDAGTTAANYVTAVVKEIKRVTGPSIRSFAP